MLKAVYLVLLFVEIAFWSTEHFALFTHCGTGFLYRDNFVCVLLTSLLNFSYVDTILFLLPWLFLIVYGFRRLKKHTISKLEHYLIICLFLMYFGFFISLILTGYNG
jgi:hypothetical protein